VVGCEPVNPGPLVANGPFAPPSPTLNGPEQRPRLAPDQRPARHCTMSLRASTEEKSTEHHLEHSAKQKSDASSPDDEWGFASMPVAESSELEQRLIRKLDLYASISSTV
jgi:hypothetical protein